MRVIHTHQINPFNTDNVEVRAMDPPGPGGACHVYQIDAVEPAQTSGEQDRLVDRAVISFQKGPIKEVGVNGISDEALFAVLIDRLQGFQRGPYSCRENAVALTHLETALLWLQYRTKARQARGVEGTSAV